MKKIILTCIAIAFGANAIAQSTLITPGNQESRNFAPDLILTSTNIPELRGQRSAGVLAAPTAVTNNSSLLQVNAFGHTGTGFFNGSQIRFASTETWTPTARGSDIEFSTTQNGTISFSEKMRILGSGFVGIGTSSPSQKLSIADGNLVLQTSTTDKVLIQSSGTASAGMITMSASNGNNSLYIRASDATNKAGEILFYDPTTNLKTMELDGDWNTTGKSRIVVDELQITGGADLAEYFKVDSKVKVEPGTILSVMSDGSAKLQIAEKAYDHKVVGVISGANGVSPGLMLQQKGVASVDGDYPIAITGRVYVKADATKWSIKAGDLLTTSDMKGYAMRAKNYKKAQGAIIGKALTDLNEGTGMVLVLLGVK
ncbi:hypothetical protein GCM10011514_21930 [Emticicia aquatilis]|uniref:Uncharacterized protein n=1 Tax=Emticicia aquatilis TaxID=1537369 RepID=A0A917DPS9_9BACT|nr:hypothetical protein [Emticicia aquatilis]GGD57438.1 hypothetical protein GCM10011514_21930 [Emticicia aquatilis]